MITITITIVRTVVIVIMEIISTIMVLEAVRIVLINSPSHQVPTQTSLYKIIYIENKCSITK